MSKPTLAVDFDGVIHSYVSPWVNAATISDAPVEGAFAFLRDAVQFFNVTVFTVRLADDSLEDLDADVGLARVQVLQAFEDWFLAHGFEKSVLLSLAFTATKPKALVYLDDRAWRFEGPGAWPHAYAMLKSRTWQGR